ncbi:MAG: FlgD immunoglobulin-like domain containing protein, partial [Bacteroidota bacterium]
DQTLPAKQYQTVRLSGAGTKTTTGGNLSIIKNLVIAAPVILNINKGDIVTLGDTLFESGTLNGAIQKSVNLIGSTTSSNFGNIGATISWSSNAPGITNVLRVSDSVQNGNGNQSVKRYYQIQPTDATATGTVVFKYSDSDLNGHDINNLQLWRSGDNGSTWQRHVPVVDTLLKTISKTNVVLAGRWTMADTARALGPLESAAGIPAIIAKVSTVPLEPVILTTLDTLKILITDIYGTPVVNVPVLFAINSMPTPTAGGTLTNTNVVTDASGIATTVFTLGSKVGVYEVIATTPNLDTIRITTTAKHGVAKSFAPIVIAQQTKPILTLLDSLFTITVSDIGGNLVKDAQVQFAIIDLPIGSFGQSLSVTNTLTDSLGRASTKLTLGSKAATYKVKATVNGIVDSVIFNAVAIPGSPSNIARFAGDAQTGVNGQTLADPFVAFITDVGGNPIQGDTVEFKVQSEPNGTTVSAVLSKTKVATDNLGQASTILTLGTKAGPYIVQAQSSSIGGALTFTATATASAAASFAAVSGNNQSTQIITALPNEFVVHVVDASGNDVVGATVNFAIDTIPANAAGQLLTSTAVASDANGIARTILTVGNKVGLYRVKASGAGVSDLFFTATATNGAASAMIASAGSDQTKPILSNLDVPFTIHVTDIGDNNVAGATVKFTIDSIPANATGQLLADTTIVSDANGIASTTLTVGNKVGLYRVKASSAGVPDRFFTATATHGTAAVFAQVTGNAQTRPTATTLDTAFVVAVNDAGGNAVPNAKVSFAITSYPANATGQRLTDTLVTADSLGVASTVLTLGDLEGSYIVAAAVPGVSAAQFVSNAFYIYGDPNNDIDVNIADMTMLVDHMYNKNTFSLGDSIKSDLNKDGKVDTTDITALRENILSQPLVLAKRTTQADSVNESGIKSGGTSAATTPEYFSDATAQLEVTKQGLRLNMTNTVPVRGIELRIRTKDSTAVDRINYLFARAQNMDVVIRSVNNEITILVYSLLNSEIQPGEGTILRLPKITSLEQIDTSQIILSVTTNKAVIPKLQTATAPASAYPTTYRLEQNYPNPFNGSTIIRYDIPDIREKETKTAIQIFNILGQRVKTLINAPHDPGPHQVVWDGTNDNGERVSTGVYFYRLITKNFLTTKKMIYVK